ncbi:MAG: arnT 4, partial [Phycisphaerales bacterium]|nr:arnT 4 [Phycisphaerales bacterium]
RVGSLWSARLPAAASGTAIALMAAWMGARWFGREFGVMAGLVTLTTYELYQYSTLAEDDIYLGLVCVACMAMFVRQLWPRADGALAKPRPLAIDLIAGRPMHTVLFFVLLGLTNLAKGPLVGAVPIIGTVGVYLLWTRDTRAMRHFAWLWGWVIFIALTLAWPLWAMKHYPDVVDNWRFDYLGQSATGDPAAAHAWDHPIWYYPAMMPLALAPWTWATIVGLIVAVHASVGGGVREKGSVYQFVACWAIVALLVLSLPARKHHQYLVPIMAPWAILSAIGLVQVGAWLKTRWPRVGAMQLATCVVVGVIIASGAIQIRLAGRDDRTAAELDLVAKVKVLVPPGEPVLINADLGSLGFFRVQYMVRHDQRLLHNLSYLLDPANDRPQWYVLTRSADQDYLARLGEVKLLAAAKVSPKDKTAGHNLALFEVKPKPGLRRVTPPANVSVLQAMGRAPGPWLDPGATAGETRGPAGEE